MLNRSASFVFLLGTALSLLTAPGISGFGLVLQGQFYSGCAIANLYYVQTWKLDNGNLGTYYASCPAGMASTFTGAMATDCKYQETNFLGRVYWAMWCIELSQLKFPAYNGFLGLTPDLYNARGLPTLLPLSSKPR